MEKMPFNEALEAMLEPTICTTQGVSADWQRGLPVLTSAHVTLRELRLSDAASLLAMLNTEEVSRFISPPPTTINGFEKFICWANSERQAGRYACFAVVPKGMDTAIGLFQVRQLEPGFAHRRVGLRDRIGVLGLRPVRRKRQARAELRVRRDRRAAARSAGLRAERPRQRGAPQDGRGA